MKKAVYFAIVTSVIIAIGCKKDSTSDNPVAPASGSRYTNNIKNAPVYLDLTTGDSVSVWDIMMDQYYNIHVNGGSSGGKGMKVAQLTTTLDATTNDTTGWNWISDVNDTTLAIKDKWMNDSTYNQETHSLSGYDTVTFVLQYDAYNWVKLHFTYFNGSNAAIRFQYSFADSVSGTHAYWNSTVHSDSIMNSTIANSHYRFGVGLVPANNWQVALVTSFYFAGQGVGYFKYPYGRLNTGAGATATWINQTYDNTSSVPTGTTFGTDGDSLYVSWIFNYNSETHILSSWNKALLVRQNGNTWKVGLDNYYDSQNNTGFVTWRYAQFP